MRSYCKTLLLMLLSIVVLSLTSCKETIDDKIDKLYKMEREYIKACNEGDFDKARVIVAEMEPVINETMADIMTKLAELEAKAASTEGTHGYSGRSASKNWNAYYAARTEYSNKVKGFSEHLKYVNDKEIYSLLAKPSTNGNQRILYLYNSYESYELPDMNDVIEVAISTGQSSLVEKLIKAGVTLNSSNISLAKKFDMEDVIELVKEDDVKSTL